MQHIFLQLFHITVIDRCADIFIQSGFDRLFFWHRLNGRIIRHRFYFIHNSGVMRRCDLCSVLPIYFISIVFRRIVACCHIDSGNAAKFSDGKRKFRRRTKALKYIGFDAVCSQTAGSFIGKFRRHSTTVKCNCDSFFLAFLAQYVIGKSLCCLTYGVYIHTVGTGSDNPAKSRCTKFKIRIKTFLDLVFIPSDRLQFLFSILIKIRICQPFFIIFHVTHNKYLLSINWFRFPLPSDPENSRKRLHHRRLS